MLTDETGVVAWAATYDPFGLATLDPNATVEMNVRFPGQYYDEETGLHYNYFRYYDPFTGRYEASDPIGIEGIPMIDKKFSKKSFEQALEKDNAMVNELSSELEELIQNKLFAEIKPKMQEIVDELNEMGHKLKFNYEPLPGDISYLDGSSEDPKLRIGLDSVISIGYADLINAS